MARVKLLVLRPGDVGEELAESLANMDILVKHAPSLTINTLPFEPPKLAYDLIIFISPTAVIHSTLLHADLRQFENPIIAVGAGTASQLREVGIDKVRVPDRFNSEGMLAMPELQQVQNKRILVVKGQGGRSLLQDTLKDRGAEYQSLDVYVREPLAIEQEVVDWYLEGEFTKGITSASVETLSAYDSQRQDRTLPIPDFILAASERIAEVANSLGYTDVTTVGGAANHFFITAMEDYLNTHD